MVIHDNDKLNREQRYAESIRDTPDNVCTPRTQPVAQNRSAQQNTTLTENQPTPYRQSPTSLDRHQQQSKNAFPYVVYV